jgi:5-methylcytosine-specific restriction endonuclease McrA
MPKKLKKKLKTISWLKKKADKIFSLWIRQREKSCYTCGSTNNLQAGHFVSRSYLALRYDERNVHTQCVACNVFKSGNMPVYARNMIRQYGGDVLEELQLFKHGKVSVPRMFYESIIQKYGQNRTS